MVSMVVVQARTSTWCRSKGLMSYALAAFYQNVLTKAPTTFLDKFCKEISTVMSHQSDHDYPWTSFPHPLSMLSQLRASEYPSVLLILVVSLYSHACWSPNTLDDNSLGSIVIAMMIQTYFLHQRTLRRNNT